METCKHRYITWVQTGIRTYRESIPDALYIFPQATHIGFNNILHHLLVALGRLGECPWVTDLLVLRYLAYHYLISE